MGYVESVASWSERHEASQRSLQIAPIFRLLLKVAVNGTHQCDFTNFWGAFELQCSHSRPYVTADHLYTQPVARQCPPRHGTRCSSEHAMAGADNGAVKNDRAAYDLRAKFAQEYLWAGIPSRPFGYDQV